MHRRLNSILAGMRQDVAGAVSRELIVNACRLAGHSWRAYTLDPVRIVHVFIVQILHGNTALTDLPHLLGLGVTASAICQARAHLPLEVFQAVLRGIVSAIIPMTEKTGLWLGHRTFLVDGSSHSMPDTPALRQHFGQPSGQLPGCGFPVAHLMALFHAGTGFLIEVFAGPLFTHDMSQAIKVHHKMRVGDILIGDRAFCSFVHLASLMVQGLHGVFRCHQKTIVDFTPNRPFARPGAKRVSKGIPRSRWLRKLGVKDQLVEWFKPTHRPAWISAEAFAQLPDSIIVRELRYRVGARGLRTEEVTLVTSLLDAEIYSAKELAALYRTRWTVELNFRHLKQTMKMDTLRCETVEGVTKELTVFALVYNLVRVVMLEAARRQGVPVDRISFINALRWLARAKPGAKLPRLVVNPQRPDRVEPRVVKRRPKQYYRMCKPRSVLRNELIGDKLAA